MLEIFREIKTRDKIPTYKYLVEGEWQESRNRKKIEIFSPIDNSLLGRIQTVLPKEADIAVCGASLAQPAWTSLGLEKRTAILEKAGELIKKHADFFQNLLTLEIGKTKKDAKHELDHGLYLLTETLKDKSWAKKERIKVGGEVGEIERIPRGVVICITPFNYPIYTTLTKIVPALVSGNALVLKPSVLGSISVLHLAQLFKKAGIPEGILNVITGRGDEIGKYLVTHRLINMVSFTGSTKAGRDIAKRAEITKLFLELGGKDAAMVLKDADLNKAAEEIVQGAFSYAGQRCVAIKRVIAEQNIKEKLIEKLKERVKKDFAVVGDPRDPKVQLGPVISDRQADYLAQILNEAVKKKAKIIYGGARLDISPIKPRLTGRILEIPKRIWRLVRRKAKGRYFQATILDDVKPNMRIAWEEQFGPILPVLSVKSAEEAVNLVNASDYGLDACIFSKNIKKAKDLAEKLEVGQVFINSRPMRFPDPFPFTGVKDSGLETEGLRYTIEAMTTIKATRE